MHAESSATIHLHRLVYQIKDLGCKAVRTHAELNEKLLSQSTVKMVLDNLFNPVYYVLFSLQGVVLNPGSPISTIEEVISDVDLILVMSVNPGFGGQSFIESQVEKIRKIKQLCNEKGVNPWVRFFLGCFYIMTSTNHSSDNRLMYVCYVPSMQIEVDGGVVPANAYKVIEAGCNAIVSGSGVFGAKDYAEAIRGIKTSKRPANVLA